MNCGKCGTDWTEGKWYGDENAPYVAVCERCYRLPGSTTALDIALEPFVGLKRVVAGRPYPSMPDVCAHSVPLHVKDACPDCLRTANGIKVRDVNSKDAIFSPRFLT